MAANLVAYTDASIVNNCGCYAVRIIDCDSNSTFKEFTNIFPNNNNNVQLERKAIINAIKVCPKNSKVTVFTDQEAFIVNFDSTRIKHIRKNENIKNLINKNNLTIHFEYAKAHCTDWPIMCEVDKLARKVAKKQSNKKVKSK